MKQIGRVASGRVAMRIRTTNFGNRREWKESGENKQTIHTACL